MSYKKGILLFLILFSAFYVDYVKGATIGGEVYDFNLNKIEDVIVFVNSEPVQRYIVKNHTYYFDLPPGTYTLTARTFDETQQILGADEQVIVREEGYFVFDLILSPVEPGETKIVTPTDTGIYSGLRDVLRYTDMIAIAIIIGLLIYIGIRFYLGRLRKKDLSKEVSSVPDTAKQPETSKQLQTEPKAPKADDSASVPAQHPVKQADAQADSVPETPESKAREWPDDETAKAVLKIVRDEKRITQKDIRKKLPDSEAKISLIISELESSGWIRKIRKGRGNIIIYNK